MKRSTRASPELATALTSLLTPDPFSAEVARRAGRVQRNGTIEDAISANTSNEPSGDWIETYTGTRFYPLTPRACDIHIEDIARALSRLCRFVGHCSHFYSVAQHSVYVSGLVPPEHQFAALMHDATEAYLGDVSRPVKNLIPRYREMEHETWLAIAERFGLPAKLPQCVKDADNRMLLREKERLLKPSERWPIPGTPAPIDIFPMDDARAYWFFMRRFDALTEGK